MSGNDANGVALSYDALGFIDVYLNGVKQVNGTDVTVSSGNSIVFASALTNGDIVEAVAFGTFNVAAINTSAITAGTLPFARGFIFWYRIKFTWNCRTSNAKLNAVTLTH